MKMGVRRVLVFIPPYQGHPKRASDRTQDNSQPRQPSSWYRLEDENKRLCQGSPDSGKVRQFTCQVEVGDGGLGSYGSHCTRVQPSQVMVSPIGSSSGCSQIVLVSQWGSSSHTLYLRKQKGRARVNKGICKGLILPWASCYLGLYPCKEEKTVKGCIITSSTVCQPLPCPPAVGTVS